MPQRYHDAPPNATQDCQSGHTGGADFILRLRPGAFTVLGDDGTKVDLPGLLAAVAADGAADTPVTVGLTLYGMG